MGKYFWGIATALVTAVFAACTPAGSLSRLEQTQSQFLELLHRPGLDSHSGFAIVNQIASAGLTAGDYQGTTLFLTDWVSRHPNDRYASYWLLMTAHAYLSMSAEPIAEYYFDRILREYPDLLVKGASIHFTCLRNLVQISRTPRNRITYFNELISRFPSEVSITELYFRLALEYEKESEWAAVLQSYAHFLAQPDASTIQIPGFPDAYRKARQLIDFNNSSKNWTFETLPDLQSAIRTAIEQYDWRALERYRAKVNFFSMSWHQNMPDANAQNDFTMRDYMRGNKVYIASELDKDSTSGEAYLRTWGWSQYVSIWYFYFRKVNFPVDPDIHGNWEWAGIYVGEKL